MLLHVTSSANLGEGLLWILKSVISVKKPCEERFKFYHRLTISVVSMLVFFPLLLRSSSYYLTGRVSSGGGVSVSDLLGFSTTTCLYQMKHEI